MPEMIKNIRAEIQTATKERAARDGEWLPNVEAASDVFLGIAGREFHCDTSQEDFRAGQSTTFVFGGDANVAHAPINDPQNIPLSAVLTFPVYIRFADRARQDNWCLERVEVRVAGASGSHHVLVAPALDGEATLWLGRESGHVLYLAP